MESVSIFMQINFFLDEKSTPFKDHFRESPHVCQNVQKARLCCFYFENMLFFLMYGCTCAMLASQTSNCQLIMRGKEREDTDC